MDRDSLLKLIDSEKDAHIAFLQAFVQAPSLNPPGDTRQAAAVISEYLRQKNVPVATMAGKAELPNVVGSFTGAGAGWQGMAISTSSPSEILSAGITADRGRATAMATPSTAAEP